MIMMFIDNWTIEQLIEGLVVQETDYWEELFCSYPRGSINQRKELSSSDCEKGKERVRWKYR